MRASCIQVTCPPWALPREEIPLLVKMGKGTAAELKNVRVDLPSSLSLRDTINLEDYAVADESVTIHSIGKADRSDFEHFGVVVATNEPFDELKRRVPIPLEFEYLDGRRETYVRHARIFRPLLEIESAPRQLVLTDAKNGRAALPIGMKFSGFGDIRTRAECTIAGRVVSVGTSVLDELLRRACGGGLIAADGSSEGAAGANRDRVERTVRRLKEEIYADEGTRRAAKEGRLGRKYINLIYGLDRGAKEALLGVAYKTVEAYLGQTVSEILGRNPSPNLQLES